MLVDQGSPTEGAGVGNGQATAKRGAIGAERQPYPPTVGGIAVVQRVPLGGFKTAGWPAVTLFPCPAARVVELAREASMRLRPTRPKWRIARSACVSAAGRGSSWTERGFRLAAEASSARHRTWRPAEAVPDVLLVGAGHDVIGDFAVPTVPHVTAALTEPLLTAADVADLLAVPRSSVSEYARRLHHPLPSVHIGRHRRFLRQRGRGLARRPALTSTPRATACGSRKCRAAWKQQ